MLKNFAKKFESKFLNKDLTMYFLSTLAFEL